VHKYLAVGRVDVEAIGAEGVVPEVEHVLPGAHHAVVHGVGYLQHGATLAGLIPHHQVLEEDQSVSYEELLAVFL